MLKSIVTVVVQLCSKQKILALSEVRWDICISRHYLVKNTS